MELSAPSAAVGSPTLGQLLKKVGDVRKEVTGDGTPVHRVLEMGEMTPAVSQVLYPSFSLSATSPTASKSVEKCR
ncbi:hypothetical protein Vadar_005212 [Vaccinium darrowii]|uniref:Uncharacterized protein n=1 Tax=Vaccinium darrowii TaxID=229202 RepID=A0ACB7Z1I6_9ERIC|nr:hypothetical protein Vadar_005212 [Vaccinium darrowii]